MEVPNSKTGVSVRAYQGDAMTLLAFDLDESQTKNFAGFSIRITAGTRKPYYLTNLLTYSAAILKKNNIEAEKAHSTFFSPIQKFRWVHVPATFHQIEEPFYGNYKYEVTPRYMVNEILQPLDHSFTVPVTIDVAPYKSGDFQIGFTRGFVESQAYTDHFGNNNKVRLNKTDLIFDIKAKSDSAKRKENGQDVNGGLHVRRPAHLAWLTGAGRASGNSSMKLWPITHWPWMFLRSTSMNRSFAKS